MGCLPADSVEASSDPCARKKRHLPRPAGSSQVTYAHKTGEFSSYSYLLRNTVELNILNIRCCRNRIGPHFPEKVCRVGLVGPAKSPG